MSKRTTFTTISPLPEGIPREVVIEFLHNHQEMIDLNPLIIERHPIPAPAHASEEEKTRCVWWSLTDRISYLPGGLVSGEIEYTAAFNDLPDGVQTHCYAPMNTDIRERWSLGGTLPGEPLEPVEIGLGAPRQGLYLREDVELRCNFMMSGFVKRTLKKAHSDLVERLCRKAASASRNNSSSGTHMNHASLYDGSSSLSYPGGGGERGRGANENGEIRIPAPDGSLYPRPLQLSSSKQSGDTGRHHGESRPPTTNSGSASNWAGGPTYGHQQQQGLAELQ